MVEYGDFNRIWTAFLNSTNRLPKPKRRLKLDVSKLVHRRHVASHQYKIGGNIHRDKNGEKNRRLNEKMQPTMIRFHRLQITLRALTMRSHNSVGIPPSPNTSQQMIESSIYLRLLFHAAYES